MYLSRQPAVAAFHVEPEDRGGLSGCEDFCKRHATMASGQNVPPFPIAVCEPDVLAVPGFELALRPQV
jgi:hypothetical protein